MKLLEHPAPTWHPSPTFFHPDASCTLLTTPLYQTDSISVPATLHFSHCTNIRLFGPLALNTKLCPPLGLAWHAPFHNTDPAQPLFPLRSSPPLNCFHKDGDYFLFTFVALMFRMNKWISCISLQVKAVWNSHSLDFAFFHTPSATCFYSQILEIPNLCDL